MICVPPPPPSKVKCILYKSYLYPNFRYFLPFYSLCSFFWKMMVISWLQVFLCDLNLLNIKMKFLLFFSFPFLSLLSFFSFSLSHLFIHSLLFSCVVKFKGVENMEPWPLTGHQAILFNCQWLPCNDHAGPFKPPQTILESIPAHSEHGRRKDVFSMEGLW